MQPLPPALNNSNTDGKMRWDYANGVLYINDGTVNRIALGKLPDGTYGLVVTKEGYDVEDVFD